MADGDARNARTATAVTKDVDDNTATVKVVINGITPPMFGDKTKPKNGTLDVKFFSWGLDLNARVQISATEFTNWHFSVKKLPSEIMPNSSSFKVKKDLVELTLQKKTPNSWVAALASGLEQADSDDEDS